MKLHRSLRRRKRPLLQFVSVLAVFGVVLLLWVGHQVGGDATDKYPSGLGDPSSTGTQSPSATPAARRSTATPGVGFPALSLGTNIAAGQHGTHVVTFSVTSDATIYKVAYVVANGPIPAGAKCSWTSSTAGCPKTAGYTYVKSPVTVTTEAHGDMQFVAAIGAQAGPTAHTITVTLTVDGRVACSRTAKDAYAVVVCYG
jgi:hypothetical protein